MSTELWKLLDAKEKRQAIKEYEDDCRTGIANHAAPAKLWISSDAGSNTEDEDFDYIEELASLFKAPTLEHEDRPFPLSRDVISPRNVHMFIDGFPAMPTRKGTQKHRDQMKTIIFFNLAVARPVGRKEYWSNPKAQTSLDAEWDHHISQGIWLMDKVREWRDVANEAVRKDETIHVGRLHENCTEKGS